MRIIKQGQKPVNTLEGKCRDCGCILECDPQEAKWLDEDRPGAGDGCYIINCPTCNQMIYLARKSMVDRFLRNEIND